MDMKRQGNLKNIWCNYEALLMASKEVKKHKSYHYGFLKFESRMVTNLNKILSELGNNTYEVKEPRSFYVYDPKTRLIEAPQLEDRIVQHAVLSATRQIIENKFIKTTYACIKERGTHQASDKLVRYLKSFQGAGYYLKMDIRKFFYTIDHSILKAKLRRLIKCEPTLQLMFKFFNNDAGKGLPLGSVTSQVFANLMLNDVDHFIKRHRGHKYYVRYMDDLIILDNNKAKLKETLSLCILKIDEEKLELNNKSGFGKISDGIDFVGYKTHYNRRVIRKRSLFKIKRTLRKEATLSRISSYLAHAKRTVSINYVISRIIESAPVHITFIEKWILKNLGINIYESIIDNPALTDSAALSGALIHSTN